MGGMGGMGGMAPAAPAAVAQSVGPTKCRAEGCSKTAMPGVAGAAAQFCELHSSTNQCRMPDCTRRPKKSSSYCIIHQSGKICAFEGCRCGAVGKTPFCKAHKGAAAIRSAAAAKRAQIAA